jgi:prepilin-type N-terminal cleavage/methylation domain-containing protein
MYRRVYHKEQLAYKVLYSSQMNKAILNKDPVFIPVSINPNRGFTIIETLVAITILMIAIAGPLVAANKSLTAALYAKDQTTALYIAQQEIETIRNIKDNNIAALDNWLNGIGSGDCPIVNNDPAHFSCSVVINNISSSEVVVNIEVQWLEKAVSNKVTVTTNMTSFAF